MMIKAVLLAVLATLVADTSAKVLHPKVKDYDGLHLPIFNYTFDNGILDDVLNVSVTAAVSDGYLSLEHGEAEVVTGNNWHNLTIPVQYPNSFIILMTQYGFVKAGENIIQDGSIYADAGDSKFVIKFNTRVVPSDDDDDVAVDYFVLEMAAEEIVLKLTESPEEAKDPLDQNEAAKEGFLKKLTEVYSKAIVPYLNGPVKAKEEGSVSLVAVRRHLKQGPLKHVKLPKSLRF